MKYSSKLPKIWFKINKIIYGKKLYLGGWPFIFRFSSAEVKIGDMCNINSGFLSNLLGLYQRTIIVARGTGKIQIGNHVGISGSTIYAREEINIGDRIKKHFISSADAWLSTGKECDKYLLHYGAQKENIYWYPFTSIYEKQILARPLTIEEKKEYKNKLAMTEELIVLSIGRFIHGKGFDVLLRALKDINNEKLGVYIVGGEETEEYKKIIKQFNLKNIHFVPFQKPEIVELYFKAADFFVFPTRGDVWGLVINEAMARALPIITTDKCVSGLELIENGKAGYVIPSDDVNILSNKIKQIINDDQSREQMAVYNLEKIKEYTIEQMAKIHMNIFKKYTERKH